jgi:hypothetical protein
MTWSTTEEDSLFLNLLTSNPVHFTIFDTTSRLKYDQAFDCGGGIL